MPVCSAKPQLRKAVHNNTPMTTKHQTTSREPRRLRRFLDDPFRG
jgi:hypothetical protein